MMNQTLQRAYYQASDQLFIASDASAVLGKLVDAHGFATDQLQQRAWQHQIKALKKTVGSLPKSDILFEFSIPRMGKTERRTEKL